MAPMADKCQAKDTLTGAECTLSVGHGMPHYDRTDPGMVMTFANDSHVIGAVDDSTLAVTNAYSPEVD